MFNLPNPSMFSVTEGIRRWVFMDLLVKKVLLACIWIAGSFCLLASTGTYIAILVLNKILKQIKLTLPHVDLSTPPWKFLALNTTMKKYLSGALENQFDKSQKWEMCLPWLATHFITSCTTKLICVFCIRWFMFNKYNKVFVIFQKLLLL